MFQDYVKDHTQRDGSDIASRLDALFRALDTAPASRTGLTAELAEFPYVNGGIFEERITLPDLNTDFRDAILDAAAVDWSTISPAIFGSMFQSVRDAQTRRELGEHYTSEENILKTLNPLFLDELRADFDAALERDTDKKKTNALNALWKRIGEIRYMDPACGCGNFVIVAYRELRAVELDIMLALQDLSGYSQLSFDPTVDLRVSLDHFYGIEIDEWPARIAETAMFLIDRQCDLRLKERFGEAPQRLPIQREAKIVVGNALRLDWGDICAPSESVVIAGNPPFVGARMKSKEQAEALEVAWGPDYNGDLDFVTGWHAKSMRYFKQVDGLWAFVTTNSICQGRSVEGLFGAVGHDGWRIKFAHRTFGWTSEATGAAAVHCVIVGFSRRASKPRLFDYQSLKGAPIEVPAKSINGYLVDAPWVLVEKRMDVLSPTLTRCGFGSMANDKGHLIVEAKDYDKVRACPVARRYIREFRGSEELVNGLPRWCLWLVGATESEIERSEILQTRVSAVREERLSSKRAATRRLAGSPHLFGERRQPETDYLCIPRVVSESRSYMTAARFPSDVVASDAVFTAEDPDGLLFAVVSSSMFMVWQRTVGGRLKSDLRFSSTIVWNNLPLPAQSKISRVAVIRAGQGILEARELEPAKSLAQHYDPAAMSSALAEAHHALDEVVDRAFGAKRTCKREEERQEVLFQRYAEMTGVVNYRNGMLPPTEDELF